MSSKLIYITKYIVNNLSHWVLPVRVEHFWGRLWHISFNWSVRSWGYIAHIRRTVGAIGGGRHDGVGARDRCYAASVPVLRLWQGQILIGGIARRWIAISRSVKAVSSGSSLKSVTTTAAGKIPILAKLIVLTADRVTIVAALNRLRDQILVNGAFCSLIATATHTAVDVWWCFGCRWDWREALVRGRWLGTGSRCVGRMIPGAWVSKRELILKL